jgi:hypothetical protein
MKSFTCITALVGLFTIALTTAIPHDDASASVDNASSPHIPHSLSLLYFRADEYQDIHTEATTCEKCTQVYNNCAKVSLIAGMYVFRANGIDPS